MRCCRCQLSAILLARRGERSPLGSSMGSTLVLLAASALIGAAAGLRLKVFALVPIALLIALVSAAVLHMNGFGPGSGIVIIIACLGLNQAAYILVQLV